jgi:hypothetical protein
MIDIRQSEQYGNYLKIEGWIVERISGINYFIRKLPLIGSVLKIQRPEKINFEVIDKLCRKYGVFQIILEPNLGIGIGSFVHSQLYARGYKISKSPYLPSKTLQIDLKQAQIDIFGRFKKDARQAIRKSWPNQNFVRKAAFAPSYGEPRGDRGFIKDCSTPDAIKRWRDAWKKSVKFNRFVPSSKQLINLRNNFPAGNSLFLASHNISGRIIGGALFTISSHERSNYISYYWQAFTNFEGRSTLSQYFLLYSGILWAKKVGCKIFDFEGIYDPRFPNKSWLGFTHFKRSFGGHEVEYPGTYTKFVLPFGL